MAGLIPLGAVVDPSKDVFATTGAHLDDVSTGSSIYLNLNWR
jgi:hypothetical protein